MQDTDVLELEIRRRIYNHILKCPGLHERELSRVLTIALSTLDYHLHYLECRGMITGRSDGRYARYYAAEGIGVKDKDVLAILRQQGTRRVIMFLLLHPHSTHRDICNHLGVSLSTTSFYLSKLEKLDIILRVHSMKKTVFFVKDPEHVSDLLITYRKTFVDESIDRFIELWMGLDPERTQKSQKKQE
ncbi:MAG: winged helix-turn-helix transcriptional regulator [Methanobacteriota archaeon]